mgnify:CR=1 FL=1
MSMSSNTDESSLKIEKGQIFIYRIFDVGDEVDLKTASLVLERNASPHRFRVKRRLSNVIIKEAPLNVSLGSCQFQLAETSFDAEIVAKIWKFGAVSLNFQLKIPLGLPFSKLIEVSKELDDDGFIEELAQQKLKELTAQISSVITNYQIWDSSEDYITYFINSFTDHGVSPKAILASDDAASLILAEDKENLSEQIRSSIRESYVQFGPKDLVLIDWNSAIVIEPSGEMDLPDVLEFALCQLLELEYYDGLLDLRLNNLYNSIEKKKGGVFDDSYSRFSQEACQKYLEISEIVENVENSIKMVGDFYLAKTFRIASEKFRFKDWQTSVDNKLNNLAEVSKLLDSKVNEKRGQIMEMTVIFLIALEVIPLLKSVIEYFSKN